MDQDGARGERPDAGDQRPDHRKGRGLMITVAGVVTGAALGYGFYRLVGCPTGACPITSNPWVSTVYGAILGALASLSLGS